MAALGTPAEQQTWARLKRIENFLNAHPDDPDLVFLSAGVGWPSHWYKIGRARGKIARSRDGGMSWERLLGGLPDGQRALFSALTIEVWPGGFGLHAVDVQEQPGGVRAEAGVKTLQILFAAGAIDDVVGRLLEDFIAEVEARALRGSGPVQ